MGQCDAGPGGPAAAWRVVIVSNHFELEARAPGSMIHCNWNREEDHWQVKLSKVR